jgi:predicted alpha/beta-hydrolase family hydrolase
MSSPPVLAIRTLEVATPTGPAQVLLQQPRRPVGLLMIGHGAGGGVEAPDILAAATAGLGRRMAVARVLQPYRVRGARATPATPVLDEAWTAVHGALMKRAALRRLPVVSAGRSSGARVACRCAAVVDATAVVALAFPLHPPGRPERSRLPELAGVPCPVLVVQGEKDPFGRPPVESLPAPSRLVVVPGQTHSFRRGLETIVAAVDEFLGSVLPAEPPQ